MLNEAAASPLEVSCPPWCEEARWGHGPAEDGVVHHDSPVQALELQHGAERLHLMVSATQDGPDGLPFVVLSDDGTALARLTAAEAAELARMLASAARLLLS